MAYFTAVSQATLLKISFVEMASMSIEDYISLDHTFKVASNLGYLRPDGNCISQYRSVFFVLSSIGQVVVWQFTIIQGSRRPAQNRKAWEHSSRE